MCDHPLSQLSFERVESGAGMMTVHLSCRACKLPIAKGFLTGTPEQAPINTPTPSQWAIMSTGGAPPGQTHQGAKRARRAAAGH